MNRRCWFILANINFYKLQIKIYKLGRCAIDNEIPI